MKKKKGKQWQHCIADLFLFAYTGVHSLQDWCNTHTDENTRLIQENNVNVDAHYQHMLVL